MKDINDILVVADPLEYVEEDEGAGQGLRVQPAFEKAVSLVSEGGTIEVLVAIYEPLLDISQQKLADIDGFNMRVKELLVESEQRKWNSYLAQHWEDQSFPFEVSLHVEWGADLAAIVLDRCDAAERDLIVKSGHRTETFFHTPTDWLLYRDAPVPVLNLCWDVNKPYSVESGKPIIVALDLLSQNQQKIWLNQQLVEHASVLAGLTDSAIHYCVAVEIPALILDLDLIDINSFRQKQEKIIKEGAEALFSAVNMPLDLGKLHVKEGKAHEVINFYAKRLKADCIVVGSTGNSGVKGKLVGNTAEKVVHNAARDLLVV